MTEASLTRAAVDALRKGLPSAVVFKHCDNITAGIPDVSITWHGRTTWVEVKYANPAFKDQGIQRLTMARLGQVGSAWYLVYAERPYRRTMIIHPRHIMEQLSESGLDGFKHELIVDFIRRTHGDNERP